MKAHAADFQVDRVGEGVGREDDGRSALVTDVQFRADADAMRKSLEAVQRSIAKLEKERSD